MHSNRIYIFIKYDPPNNYTIIKTGAYVSICVTYHDRMVYRGAYWWSKQDRASRN